MNYNVGFAYIRPV